MGIIDYSRLPNAFFRDLSKFEIAFLRKALVVLSANVASFGDCNLEEVQQTVRLLREPLAESLLLYCIRAKVCQLIHLGG